MKMGFKEMDYAIVYWIHMFQDRDQ